MKKIVFALIKSKFNSTLFKQANKSPAFSLLKRAAFSTLKDKEEIKVDAVETDEDFKPKIKPAPEKNYETFYPEIEKVFL